MKKASSITPAQFAEIQKELRQQKKIIVRIISDSMEPLIKTGEEIQLESFNSFDDLRRFDVIVFYHNNILTCHYLWHVNSVITKENQRLLVTRPLGRHYDDFPVTENNVLGWVPSRRLSLFQKIKIIFRFWLQPL